MDFFQGSLPPNFICFCLDNQNPDELQVQTTNTIDNSAGAIQRPVPISVSGYVPGVNPSPPPFPPIRAARDQTEHVAADISFHGANNASAVIYAGQGLQRMETMQGLTEANSADNVEKDPNAAQGQLAQIADHDAEFVRSSTPNPPDQPGTSVDSLTQLETSLSVTPKMSTGFPELQVIQDQTEEMPEVSFLQSKGDASSSVMEPPPLPGGKNQVEDIGESSDVNQLSESVSQGECPPLYAINPFDSAQQSETGDESGSEVHDPGQPGTSRADHSGQNDTLRNLSVRSRATLKQYFETEDPYTFPVGQRVVAFTEPQVYHLLRVLTDEAINMTCSTMERMVIGAVRGTPATAPSRTEKFQIRTRPSTPGSNLPAGSSSEGTLAEVGSGYESQTDMSLLQDVSDFLDPNESDSPTEMVLINQTLGIVDLRGSPQTPQPAQPQDTSEEGAETGGRSSLDVTLSEIRDRTPTQRSRKSTTTARPVKVKKVSRRGVPMREEFLSKIGWTRSFISGPSDPLHNPHMVWCHMCKKNFSIKTKGTVEILRHHRTEKHLRRDQRWRYEHLKTVDPVTGKVQHRVRGRNGKILSKKELADELPRFIHTELVDVGERNPFYEDYLQGHTSAPITPQSRLRTQICLLGDFIQGSGDLALLQKLWSRVGSYTGFQSAFQDFNWNEDHIMVRSLSCFPKVGLVGREGSGK